MKTSLITGANGYIGKQLAGQLATKGHTIIATSRNGLGHTIKMDFTNEAEIKNVLFRFKPAIIIHCGAKGKPDECELNKEAALLANATATGWLVQNAAAIKAYFIYLSTDFVFDGSKAWLTEADKPSPVNYYGFTKLLGEQAVLSYSNSCIIRTVLVYGKYMDGRENLVSLTKKKLEAGEAFKVVNDQVRTPTYLNDLLNGIEAVVNKEAKGLFHISGSEMFTPYEIALETATFLGLDTSALIPVTKDTFKEIAQRPQLSGFNCQKAFHELGYKPTPFRSALKKIF